MIVNGHTGVVPNQYQKNPMKFVKCAICEPILSSQFKFERFEVRWDPEVLPNLNTEEDGQDIMADPRLVLVNAPLQNAIERNSNNPASTESSSKVIFCIQFVP